MFNLILGSMWVRNVISNCITRAIRKKAGYDTQLYINELDIRETEGDYVRFRVGVEMIINSSDLEKIIEQIGKEEN